MNKLILALVLLCCCSLLYGGQESSRSNNAFIEISGTKLHLGMTMAEVKEKLAGDTSEVKENLWIVGSNIPGPIVQFTKGRLNFANRIWTTPDNDFPVALWGAVNTLNEQGFDSCKVTAGSKVTPDSESHNIWIDCGEKSVLLTRQSMSGKIIYTRVYEQLGKMHDTPD